MARCPHCNMVLSGSEAKASHCAICKGALAGSSGSSSSAAAAQSEASSTASPEAGWTSSGSDVAASSAPATAAPASSPAGAGRSELPRFSKGTLVLLLLAVWCLVMLVWFAGGDAARIPPRLLGAILLAAPIGLAAYGARE